MVVSVAEGVERPPAGAATSVTATVVVNPPMVVSPKTLAIPPDTRSDDAGRSRTIDIDADASSRHRPSAEARPQPLVAGPRVEIALNLMTSSAI